MSLAKRPGITSTSRPRPRGTPTPQNRGSAISTAHSLTASHSPATVDRSAGVTPASPPRALRPSLARPGIALGGQLRLVLRARPAQRLHDPPGVDALRAHALHPVVDERGPGEPSLSLIRRQRVELHRLPVDPGRQRLARALDILEVGPRVVVDEGIAHLGDDRADVRRHAVPDVQVDRRAVAEHLAQARFGYVPGLLVLSVGFHEWD